MEHFGLEISNMVHLVNKRIQYLSVMKATIDRQKKEIKGAENIKNIAV